MRLYWRLSDLPELGHLPEAYRGELIRHARGKRFVISTIAKSLFLGLFFGGIAATLSSMAPVAVRGIIAIFGLAVGFGAGYLLCVLRVRAELRLFLMRAFKDGTLPVCFKCGYDLTAATGSTCPECGAKIQV